MSIQPPRLDVAMIEKLVHQRVNQQRQRQGLGALNANPALAAIARAHSRDMVQREYMDHQNPEGLQVQDRYRIAGFKCAIRVGNTIYGAAENIALGRRYNRKLVVPGGEDRYEWNSEEAIATAAVEGWMNSAAHRANLLMPYFGEQGIGVALAAGNRILITQNFC